MRYHMLHKLATASSVVLVYFRNTTATRHLRVGCIDMESVVLAPVTFIYGLLETFAQQFTTYVCAANFSDSTANAFAGVRSRLSDID